MSFRDLLVKLRRTLLKHKRFFIYATCTTVSTAVTIPFVTTYERSKLSDESLREIAEALGINEKSNRLPISERDNIFVNGILTFENTYKCKIYFVHSDKEGSHYRVDNNFGVDYSKSHLDIYEKFFEIVGDTEIISECKKRKAEEKLLIRNKSKKGVFSEKDQSDNIFKEGNSK